MSDLDKPVANMTEVTRTPYSQPPKRMYLSEVRRQL